ncbi:MAG: acyltransferase [bacterium]
MLRNDYAIDLLRWMAIVAVVIIHSGFVSRYSENAIHIILRLQMILGWCVLCFFSISGFLQAKKELTPKAFLNNRFQRLIIPYFCVSLIVWLILYAINGAGIYHPKNANDLNVINFAKRMLCFQGMGPQFYFLPYLFIISFAVFLLKKGIAINYIFYIALACVILQFVMVGHLEVHGGNPECLGLYFTSYTLGMMLAGEEKGMRSTHAILLLGTCAGLLIVFYFHEVFLMFIFLPVWLYQGIKACKSLTIAGKFMSSFSAGAVYLWHTPILLPVCSILLQKSGIHDLANFLLSCIAAIVASLILHEGFKALNIDKYLSL